MVKVESKVQRYESYKDSGISWLGEIPEHWEITRLANIGRFSSSGIDKLIKNNESVVKIINYTDVYRNLEHTINSKMDYMEVTTPETNRVKNLVKKGDLIFLPSSETLEDLGLAALVDEDVDNLSFSYHVLRFEFSKEISHKFKKYFTNNEAVLNEFSKKGTGSIRKTLGRNDFRNTIVILPPLQEQTKIAQFLDDKTTKIDEAIAIKEQQIQLLKERKQILIHKAVTQGLNPNVTLKDSGVEWIGEIPEGWEVKKIKHVTNKIGSGVTPSGGGTTYLEEGIPLLRSQNIFFDSIELDGVAFISNKVHQSMSNSQVFKGDVLLNITGGSIGRCYFVNIDIPLNVNQHVCILRPNNKITTLYLNSLIASEIGQNQIWFHQQGGGREGLNFQALKNFSIPFPPLSEQKEISAYIETASQKIETAIGLKQQEIEKLKEYKRSLINGVVTGKVRVC